jgi:hypothetical protein
LAMDDARMAIPPTTRDRVGDDVFGLLRHRILVGDVISRARASCATRYPAVSRKRTDRIATLPKLLVSTRGS